MTERITREPTEEEKHVARYLEGQGFTGHELAEAMNDWPVDEEGKLVLDIGRSNGK